MKRREFLKIAAFVTTLLLLFCSCKKEGTLQDSPHPTEVETIVSLPEAEVVAEPEKETMQETLPEPKEEEKPLQQEAFKEKKVEASSVTEEKEEPPQQKAEAATETLAEETCFISVRCDTILKSIELLAEEKRSSLPPDGKILSVREVSFEEGESAFDILLRVLREEKIHIEFMKTTAYNSAYIEGIANIYEKDCGNLSGWMYTVNGTVPNVGSSSYQPQVGDKIEWVYTCDAGRDIADIGIDE